MRSSLDGQSNEFALHLTLSMKSYLVYLTYKRFLYALETGLLILSIAPKLKLNAAIKLSSNRSVSELNSEITNFLQ